MLTMVHPSAKEEQSELELFAGVARDHYEPVYRFILRQVPSSADAADLTQETFLRAQKAFPKYDQERPFAPWIFRIARRQLADYFRRRPPQATDVLEADPADPGADPLGHAERAERSAMVWRQAARLKPKLHQVLLLHYEEGFSIAEMGEVMGLTQTHVKVLLFRARSALKKHLSSI